MNGTEGRFIKDAFDTNWIAPLGPNVDHFEQELCAYVGAGYGAALSSGTAALHLALRALDIGEGDVVFCSSLTFSASCNPILYQHASPVFIDSEPESWNMSPRALEKAFARYPDPKAVVVVDLYGQSADMERILALCESHHVPVIEDAAESLGATYRGKQSGTFGKIGVYSFNGNKIITTSGGGMLVSADAELVGKVRFLATQARDPAPYYQHSELGYNYRMSNILAGIGRGQILTLGERIAQKKRIYDAYAAAFSPFRPLRMNPIRDFGEPNYWLSCMTISEDSAVRPQNIIAALERENIESRPIWKPMQLQPLYRHCDFFSHNDAGRSVSEDIFQRGVCLPSDVKMSDDDIADIVGTVGRLFREERR